MEENLSLGRQLFHRVWLQGWMSKVIRFLCFWVLLVVKMLLVVSVVPFLLVVVVVVVLLLWLGRLEVGHWRKALLAKVVFNCPPLYFVLQLYSQTGSRSWDIAWCIVKWAYLGHNCQLFPCLKGKVIRVLILDHIWTQFGSTFLLTKFFSDSINFGQTHISLEVKLGNIALSTSVDRAHQGNWVEVVDLQASSLCVIIMSRL